MNEQIKLGSKGQVIVIIGVILALGISIISITADFETALQRRTLTTGIEGTRILTSIDRGIMETYQTAASSEASYQNIAERTTEFLEFTRGRSRGREMNYILSLTVHHNETMLKSGVINLMGRTMTDVEINGSVCDSNLGHGDSCLVEIDGVEDDYTVELSYSDPEKDIDYTRTYGGPLGEGGNHSSVFYRIELDLGTTELTRENTAWSKQIQ